MLRGVAVAFAHGAHAARTRTGRSTLDFGREHDIARDSIAAVAFVTLRHHALLPIEYKVLASGRTSPKQMPSTKFRELYQTHVCSAGIRAAREMFSLLPLARVLVHVVEVRLNPATGHSAPETLLSVDFDRERLLNVNFDRIDPPSAVESFRHAMNFKKSVGLLGVDALEPLAQLNSLDEIPAGRQR